MSLCPLLYFEDIHEFQNLTHCPQVSAIIFSNVHHYGCDGKGKLGEQVQLLSLTE